MISLILFVVASAAMAIAETLDEKFSVSVFRNLNPEFWSKEKSYRNKDIYFPKLPRWIVRGPLVVFTDAWHIFKGISIVGFAGAVVAYRPVIMPGVDLVGLLLVYEGVFESLYGWLLVGKADKEAAKHKMI